MDEKNKKGTLKPNNEKGDTKNPSPKTQLPQSAEIKALIEQRVTEALKEARASWDKEFETRIVSEREEAAKLATMTSEERAKAEIEKSRQDFETERAQYISEKSEFEAAKELAAQGLPVTFARMVADADKEIMMENITAFKSEYLKAIEVGLSERLKGREPRLSKEKEPALDPFLSGLGF